MSTYYISNELSHHGVKGMKWGVRKQPMTVSQRLGTRPRMKIDAAISRKVANRTSNSKSRVGKMVNRRALDRAASSASYKKYSETKANVLKLTGKNFVQNINDSSEFWKTSYKSVKNKDLKGVKKAYQKYMNTELTVLGVTGTTTVKRKNYLTGNYNKFY